MKFHEDSSIPRGIQHRFHTRVPVEFDSSLMTHTRNSLSLARTAKHSFAHEAANPSAKSVTSYQTGKAPWVLNIVAFYHRQPLRLPQLCGETLPAELTCGRQAGESFPADSESRPRLVPYCGRPRHFS